MKKFKKHIATLLSAVTILSLTACGSATPSPATSANPINAPAASSTSASKPKQDTLTVAYRSEPSNLDPVANASLTAFDIENMMFDRLVYKNPKGEIVPMLATKWEIVDQTTIKFYLRNDVKFSNGEPLTAEDVKFSLTRAETSASSKPYFGVFNGKETKIIDPYTIEVKLYKPFAPALAYLASARGNIVSKKAVETAGEAAFGRAPVGSGKFKFVSWTAGDRTVFVRNDNYWGEKPAYKNFIARYITDATARSIELETGGVDIAFHVQLTDMPRLASGKDTQLLTGPSYQTVYMYFNVTQSELYKDIRVRQALAMALDVPTIVKNVYGDSATAADSLMSPALLGYSKVGNTKYDPSAAKALLQQANFDFSKEYQLSVAEDTQYAQIAEIAQNMWKAIGVNVKVVVMDSTIVLTKSADGSGSLPFCLNSTNAATGDPDQGLVIWKPITNTIFKLDPSVYKLMEEATAEYDTAKRAALYEKIQRACWDYYGLIPIAFNNVVYGARKSVTNLYPDPGAGPDLSIITFK